MFGFLHYKPDSALRVSFEDVELVLAPAVVIIAKCQRHALPSMLRLDLSLNKPVPTERLLHPYRERLPSEIRVFKEQHIHIGLYKPSKER